MIEREIKKLELQNGLVPFDEWFDSLRDKRMQAAVCLNCGSRLGRGSAFIMDFTAGKLSSCWLAVINAVSRATSAARNNCGNNL